VWVLPTNQEDKMSHRNAPTALILVVTKTKTVGGYSIKLHKIESRVLPYRLAKRSVHAHSIGLTYVRSLEASKALSIDPTGVQAVTVTDGKRALASWKRMECLGGFTGTHDVHELIKMHGIK
jgi:hypothetical protein